MFFYFCALLIKTSHFFLQRYHYWLSKLYFHYKVSVLLSLTYLLSLQIITASYSYKCITLPTETHTHTLILPLTNYTSWLIGGFFLSKFFVPSTILMLLSINNGSLCQWRHKLVLPLRTFISFPYLVSSIIDEFVLSIVFVPSTLLMFHDLSNASHYQLRHTHNCTSNS